MQPLPNQTQPFVRMPNGNIIPPWNSYLQQFTTAPPPFIQFTLAAAPTVFNYEANEPGYIAISGGTITGITWRRATANIALAVTTAIIPLGINDIINVAYSVIPTKIIFVPLYGAVAA